MHNQAKPAGNAEYFLAHWAGIGVDEDFRHAALLSAAT
jgi:hypothetical protein